MTCDTCSNKANLPLLALAASWRAKKAHTYSSENADEYRAYDAGLEYAATELENVLSDKIEEPPVVADGSQSKGITTSNEPS